LSLAVALIAIENASGAGLLLLACLQLVLAGACGLFLVLGYLRDRALPLLAVYQSAYERLLDQGIAQGATISWLRQFEI
jgi:hypothetical protein